jgi:RimJ/RimL family protein N-acetyltransferase
MKLDSKFEIVSENYLLRPLLPQEVGQDYLDWFEDESVKKFIMNRPQSIDELKTYVQEHYERDDSLLLGIYSDELHIGNIKFEPISPKKGTAIFGVIIGNSSFRGKGLLQELFPLMSKKLNEVFNIDKIYLGVEPDNVRAIKSYEKCNFVRVAPEESPLDSSKCFTMLLKNS